MIEIDLSNTNSIINFGADAQEKLTTISTQMLNGVKNKDLGQTAEPLSQMISAIRGFDMDELNPNKSISFFDKLLGRTKPLAMFLSKYEDVKEQIESITDELEKQKGTLLNDVESLERLYDANLEYIHNLEKYIDAGEKRLSVLDTEEIPQLALKSKNSANILDAQKLKDLHYARDDFQKRIHDLKLTRQVALQALPSIRMVQDNDKTLISKINSTLINTVPLWKNQLAQTITIYRNQKAGKLLKDAMDLTNELLEANAKNFKNANKQTQELAQKGIFDIESIKLANKLLIETIEESLSITMKGNESRQKVQEELQSLESELKNSLLKATKTN